MQKFKAKKILALALSMTMIFGALPAVSAVAEETPVEVVESVADEEIAAEETEEIVEDIKADANEEIEEVFAETVEDSEPEAVENEETEALTETAGEENTEQQINEEVKPEEIAPEEVKNEEIKNEEIKNEEENPFGEIEGETEKDEEEVLAEENAAVTFAVTANGTAVTGSPFATLQEAIDAVPAGGTAESNVITLSGAWNLTEAQTLNVANKNFKFTGGNSKVEITKNNSLFAANSYMFNINGSGQIVFEKLIFNGGWNGTSTTPTGRGIHILFPESDVSSKVTFNSCEIKNNYFMVYTQAESGASVSAGVLIRHGGDVVFNDTLIQKNHLGWALADEDVQYTAITGGINALRNKGDVTISNCRVLDNKGFAAGGIRVLRDSGSKSGTLRIEGSTFENNDSFEKSNGGGAVVSNRTENVYIDNSTFKNNDCYSGGAGGALLINVASLVTIKNNSVFELNSAEGVAGAVFCASTDELRVEDSRFTKNTGSYGGAFYNRNVNKAYYSNATFNDNTAEGGGAVYLRSPAILDISGGEFKNNKANTGSGGAVYLRNIDSNEKLGKVSIKNCLMEKNSSYTSGGAVYCNVIQEVQIDTVRFIENTCTNSNGGGIACDTVNEMRVKNSVFNKNTASLAGGAILVWNTNMADLLECEIKNNKANGASGGAIRVWNVDDAEQLGRLTVRSCVIEDNSSEGSGGGISATQVDLRVIDANINKNKSLNGDGGGVYLQSGSFTALNSHFDENRIENRDSVGGSLRFNNYFSQGTLSGVMVMHNCTVNNNIAAGSVGAIWMHTAANVTIKECEISGNTAGGRCGALYIASANDQSIEGNIVVVDTAFKNNRSQANGGAVLVSGRTSAVHSNVKFLDCTFEECRSVNGIGGAMSIGSANDITISGCTFKNNAAQNAGGAIANNSDLKVISCDFTNNEVINDTAEGRGGAFWLSVDATDATVDLTKVIITGNNAGSAGAIYAGNGIILNFNSVEVRDNEPNQLDGAVIIDNSTLNIVNGTNIITDNGPVNLNLTGETGETVGVLKLTKMNASSKIGVTKKGTTPAEGVKFGVANDGAEGAEYFYADADSTFYGIVDRGNLVWKKDTTVVGETATISRPIQHGDADVSPAVVPVGRTMTVNTYPDDGYMLDKIVVTRRTDGAPVTVNQSNGRFTMPAGGVNIEVTFKEDPSTFEYPVDIIRPISYGDAIANPEKAKKGERVTLTTTPLSNMYILDTLRVVAKVGGRMVTVTNKTFVMPEGGVNVYATFKEDPNKTKFPVDISRPISNGDADANVKAASVGETVYITATPVNEFYMVDQLEVRTKSGNQVRVIKDGTSYTGRFSMPNDGVNVIVTFKPDPNKTQYPADIMRPIENGNATVDKVTAARGEEVTVTAVPNSYYVLDEIEVTRKQGGGKVTVANGVFTMPEGGVDIRVTFKNDPNAEYPVEVTVIGYGAATPSKAVAKGGESVEITTTAENGFVCSGVTGRYELNGTVVPVEIRSYYDYINNVFSMPYAKVSIEVTFVRDPNALYPVQVETVGNGMAMALPASAKSGSLVKIITKPDEGYRVKEITGRYDSGAPNSGITFSKTDTGYEFTMPGYWTVVTVTFEEDPDRTWGADLARPIIHGDAGLSPRAVSTGKEMTVNTFPDEGYILERIAVTAKNGGKTVDVSVDSNGNGTFTMPAGGVNVSVTFKEDPAMIKYPVNIVRPIVNGDAVASPATAIKGSTVIIEMNPDEGYLRNNIVVTAETDGRSIPVHPLPNGNGSFEMPEGGARVVASFKEDPAKIKYPVNIIRPIVNGDIAVDKNEAVMGSNITLTATPANDKYMVDTVTVTAIKTNTAVTVTNGIFTMPEGGVNVVATFKEDPAKIEYPVDILRPIAFGDASASPAKAVKGAPVTLTTTPVSDLYIVNTLKVIAKNGAAEVPVNNNVFTMPEGGVNVEVTFKLDPAKIKYPVDIKRPISNGDATADPAEAVRNADVTINTTPENEHYLLDKIVVTKKTDEASVTVTNGKFKMPEGGAKVVVTFKPDPQNPPPGMEEPVTLKRPIIHGDASLEPERVMAGGTMTVNNTPDPGYELNKIAVTRKTDGSEVPVNGNGAFTMPSGGVDIEVTFKRIGMNKDFESFIIDKTNGTVEIYSNEDPANSGAGTVTVFTNNPRLVIITAYSNNTINFNKIPGTSEIDVSGDYKYTFPVSGLTEGSSRRIYIALKGDVNFNGKILASDAHQIARCATGLRDFDELQMLVGDVDNSDNGKRVSITDAQQTAKYAANISNFVK